MRILSEERENRRVRERCGLGVWSVSLFACLALLGCVTLLLCTSRVNAQGPFDGGMGGPGGMQMGRPGGMMMGGPGGMQMGGRGGMMGGPGGMQMGRPGGMMMGGPGGMQMGGRGGMMGGPGGGMMMGGPGGGMMMGGPGGAGGGNDRIVSMLKNMDANNDGRLDPSEVPESRKPFVQMMAQRLGVDGNRTINLRALERSRSSGSQAGSKTSTLPENPLVPYFGEPATAMLLATSVLAFGQAEGATALATTTNQSNQRRGQQRGMITPEQVNAQQQQIIKAARDLLTRNDKNRNGVLDKLNDEWNGLPFDTNTADKNKDGRLTLSEIVVALGGKASGIPAVSVGGTQSFQDRMPAVVPDWYTQMDKNKDGQLSLVEYSEGKPYTDAMLAEFEEIDRNDDGFITIAECYAHLQHVDETKKKAEEAARIEAARAGGLQQPQSRDNPRGPRGGGNDNRSGAPPQIRPAETQRIEVQRTEGQRIEGQRIEVQRNAAPGGRTEGGRGSRGRPQGGNEGNWGGDRRR